jgi:hypothetical protein
VTGIRKKIIPDPDPWGKNAPDPQHCLPIFLIPLGGGGTDPTAAAAAAGYSADYYSQYSQYWSQVAAWQQYQQYYQGGYAPQVHTTTGTGFIVLLRSLTSNRGRTVINREWLKLLMLLEEEGFKLLTVFGIRIRI